MQHRQLGQKIEKKKGAGVAHQHSTQATRISNRGMPFFSKKLKVDIGKLESEKYEQRRKFYFHLKIFVIWKEGG